jgi:RimJ/RimL family protein N-acetyltransferase
VAVVSVTVRTATVEDIDAVLDVFEAVAAEGRWVATEVPFDRRERARRFEQTIVERDDATMFVALDGDTIVGQLFIELSSYGVADLGMSVAADHRGQGVGSALMEAGIGWARQKGAHKITLQVWPHNEPAIGLYRKFGFEQEGLLRRHYRRKNGELWDAVVMGLVL